MFPPEVLKLYVLEYHQSHQPQSHLTRSPTQNAGDMRRETGNFHDKEEQVKKQSSKTTG
jgi:hypothetical protein